MAKDPPKIPPQKKQDSNHKTDPTLVSSLKDINPLIPYVEKMKRSYDFSSYAAIIGSDATINIAKIFAKWLQTYKPGRHVNKNYTDACEFIDYAIKIGTKLFPTVIHNLKNSKKPEQLDWQKIASSYRSSITDPNIPLAKSTMNGKCNRTSAFLKQLTIAGITPKVVLPGVRQYRGTVKPTKGAAELVRNTGRSVSKHANKNEIRFGTSPAEKQQIEDIINALGGEGVRLSAEDPDFAERALEINNSRLADLRECAKKEFIQHWNIFQKGQNLIGSCDLSYRDDMLPLFEDYIKKFSEDSAQFSGNRGHSFTRLFDDIKVPLELRQGRFLSFIKHRYCGIYPENPFNYEVKSDWEAVIPFHKRGVRLFGSRTKTMRHLNADYDALLCAHIIILIDTCLNVSTVDDLPHDCLVPSTETGQYYISGWKDRDGGREKLAAVGEETAQLIRMLLDMTSNYRFVAATGGDSDWRHPLIPVYGNSIERKLFITLSPKHVIAKFISDSARSAFNNFLDRHDCLKGIPWTFEAIRNSVAQKRFWDGDFDIASTATELGHAKGSRCTTGYVVRRAAKQQLEREIRRFQTLFEAVCVADIPGAAKALGYSTEELQTIIDEACRSGLGVVCWKKIQGENIQDNTQSNCTPQDDCPKCDYKKIVPTSLPNLVDLILHHDYLEGNKTDLQSDNPERWAKVHMPWLALSKAMLEKVKRSSLVSREVLNEAQTVANQLKSVCPPFI